MRWAAIATALLAGATLTPFASTALASATTVNLCHPRADTVPPQVSMVAFNKALVDVGKGAQKLGVTVDATDTSANGAGSGVRRVDVYVSGPKGELATRLALTHGTSDDGVWKGTLVFPIHSASGIWHLTAVFVGDRAGNQNDYLRDGRYPESPTDVRLQSGWDETFGVRGTQPVPKPIKPGHLTGLTVSSSSVNTTHAAKRVRVRATFAAPQPRVLDLTSERITTSGSRVYLQRKLTYDGHGVWVGHVAVPRWVGRGRIELSVQADYYPRNVRPDFRTYTSQWLKARHLPSAIGVVSLVDRTPPVLHELTVTPVPVDTTSGAAALHITARATDNRSKVAEVAVELSIRSHGVNSPGDSIRVDLTKQGPLWVGVAHFQECVPSGTWHVSADLRDNADNYATYPTRTLVADGLLAHVAVTSTPGDIVAPWVTQASASSADHTITLEFTEGVKNISSSTLDVFATASAPTRFQSPEPVSAFTCVNGTTTVDCDGSSQLVTSVQLDVPGVTSGHRYEVWANLGAVTPQLTDGNGNPMAWDGPVAELRAS